MAGTIGRLSISPLRLSRVVAKPRIEGVKVDVSVKELPCETNSCHQS